MTLTETFNKWFWSERFWLSGFNKNVSWMDFENTPEMLAAGYYIPQISDLYWTFLVGILLLGIRYLYENYLVVPFARSLGMKEKRTAMVQPNSDLEATYKKNNNPDDETKLELSKKLDLPLRQVEMWFRQRSAKDAVSKTQKFRECSWQFLVYFGSTVYGIAMLWNKPWLWETKQCWIGWPKQHVTNDVFCYYIMELGIYLHLLFAMTTDHKRKDSAQMTIHHLITILLIYLSWGMNFVRLGTLSLMVHDPSDVLLMFSIVQTTKWRWLQALTTNFSLAASKMSYYAKWKTAAEVFFIMFVLVWIITRLVLYPFVVIYCALIELFGILKDRVNGIYISTICSLVLVQIFHIIWTYMIAKVVMKKLRKGKMSDTRSDSESDDEQEIQTSPNKHHDGESHVTRKESQTSTRIGNASTMMSDTRSDSESDDEQEIQTIPNKHHDGESHVIRKEFKTSTKIGHASTKVGSCKTGHL